MVSSEAGVTLTIFTVSNVPPIRSICSSKFVSLVGLGQEIDDQFWIQIRAPQRTNDKVVGRIEYVEVTRAGQAFRSLSISDPFPLEWRREWVIR